MAEREIDLDLVIDLVLQIVKRLDPEAGIPVGVSNRHIHLTEGDYRTLFGDQPFQKHKDLNQTGEYASNRVVDVLGPKATLRNVRILGPFRKASQAELSKTDARMLGMEIPVRMSGDIQGSPAITLIGPAGQLDLPQGAIVAQRHVHMSPLDAARFQVRDGDKIDIRVPGERPAIFCDTVVRVHDDFVLELHLDTDEANAVGSGPMMGYVVKP